MNNCAKYDIYCKCEEMGCEGCAYLKNSKEEQSEPSKED